MFLSLNTLRRPREVDSGADTSDLEERLGLTPLRTRLREADLSTEVLEERLASLALQTLVWISPDRVDEIAGDFGGGSDSKCLMVESTRIVSIANALEEKKAEMGRDNGCDDAAEHVVCMKRSLLSEPK